MRALRDIFASSRAALCSPLVFLALWGAITAIAIWPAARAGDVAANDGPRWSSPTVLPADGDHLAALDLDLTASLALALIVGIFFAGGILTCVGAPVRRPFREFLAESASWFLTNVRVLLVFAVLALALGWGVDAADHALRHKWLVGKEPGDVAVPLLIFDLRWAHVLAIWNVFCGALFLGLVFVAKVAMAWLVANGRRTAVVAACAALARCARQPIRVALIVSLWMVLWVAASFAFGELTVRLLEVRSSLWLGALASQLGVLASIVVWIGFTASARRVVTVESA